MGNKTSTGKIPLKEELSKNDKNIIINIEQQTINKLSKQNTIKDNHEIGRLNTNIKNNDQNDDKDQISQFELFSLKFNPKNYLPNKNEYKQKKNKK